MTGFAFYCTFVTRFSSYSLLLENLQAHDLRFPGPLLSLQYPLYLDIHSYPHLQLQIPPMYSGLTHL